MAATRAELTEQKRINAELQRRIDALKAAHMGEAMEE